MKEGARESSGECERIHDMYFTDDAQGQRSCGLGVVFVLL